MKLNLYRALLKCLMVRVFTLHPSRCALDPRQVHACQGKLNADTDTLFFSVLSEALKQDPPEVFWSQTLSQGPFEVFWSQTLSQGPSEVFWSQILSQGPTEVFWSQTLSKGPTEVFWS